MDTDMIPVTDYYVTVTSIEDRYGKNPSYKSVNCSAMGVNDITFSDEMSPETKVLEKDLHDMVLD